MDPFPLILFFEGAGRGKGVAVVDDLPQLFRALATPTPLVDVERLGDESNAAFLWALIHAAGGDVKPLALPDDWHPND